MIEIADREEYWARYLPRMHELIALGLHLGSYLQEEMKKAADKGSRDPERDGLIACMKSVFPKRKRRLPPLTIVDHEREKRIGIGSLKILELNRQFGFGENGIVRVVNLIEYGENDGRVELSPGLVSSIRTLIHDEEGYEYDFYALLDLIKNRLPEETDYFDKRDKCQSFKDHLHLTDEEFINPFNTKIFLSPDDIFAIHKTYVEKAKSLGML